MAQSKCGHCGKHDFEQKTIKPAGATERVDVIQCSTCGTVVGTLQTDKLDGVTRLASQIDTGLRAIVEALNRR